MVRALGMLIKHSMPSEWSLHMGRKSRKLATTANTYTGLDRLE
jgi:hypothetical protein